MIPARPTTYRGIQMRSRLEAEFAAILDLSGLPWAYEPRAYANRGGQYLPDFELRERNRKVFFEVRPTLDGAYRAMRQMAVILDSEPGADLWSVALPLGLAFLSSPEDRTWRTHRFGQADGMPA